jgi:hypothetical protein
MAQGCFASEFQIIPSQRRYGIPTSPSESIKKLNEPTLQSSRGTNLQNYVITRTTRLKSRLNFNLSSTECSLCLSRQKCCQ